MGEKRYSWKTIRGWFPQEPYLHNKAFLNAKKKENRFRFFFSKSPLGLKLIAVMFWVFGAIACLMIIDQLRVFAYLPFPVKALIMAVTVMDAAAMFIVGVGVLTLKKRWIDAAIVFSAVSIVVFYVVPLRAAFPLELVAIAYLLTLRKGSFSKRRVPTAVTAASLALVVLVFSSTLVPVYAQNAELINPSKTVIQKNYQTSEGGYYGITAVIYRTSDLDPEHDYYFLEITLNTSQSGVNYAKINASLPTDVNVFPSWTPHSNPSAPTTLSLGVASIYVGNTDQILVYTGSQNEGGICWVENVLGPKEKSTFTVETLVVNQDAHFSLNLTTEAGLKDKIFGNLWTDKLVMEGMSV